MKLLDDTIASTAIGRPIPTDEQPQGLCLDRGYDYDSTRESVTAQRFVPHIRTRGEDTSNQLRDPDWKPRRWVVESHHSWLNRNRGILIRWSKKDENHLALLQLASGLIAFKKVHAASIAAAC
jgi:putative transposase